MKKSKLFDCIGIKIFLNEIFACFFNVIQNFLLHVFKKEIVSVIYDI